MRISTFFYTIKQGCINIFRNKWFTLASIATIGACLFLFGLFYAIIANFQNIVKTAQEGVSVTVFFDEGISQERIEEIDRNIGYQAIVDNGFVMEKEIKKIEENLIQSIEKGIYFCR